VATSSGDTHSHIRWHLAVLLDAPCEADVRAVAERAAIEVDRVVLAEQIDPRRQDKS
jgi:hypothetical protein